MGYMEILAKQIASVTDEQLAGADRRVSKSALGANDHVVGTMDSQLQPLFCVWQNAKLAFKRVVHEIELKFTAGEDMNAELAGRLLHAKDEDELLANLFWHSVRVAHPELAGKTDIGLRAGWQVVWTDPSEPSITDMLSGVRVMVMGMGDENSEHDSAEGGLFATLSNLFGRRTRDPRTVN